MVVAIFFAIMKHVYTGHRLVYVSLSITGMSPLFLRYGSVQVVIILLFYGALQRGFSP